MAYADYTYYSETWLGDAIAEADFPRLSERASEIIDQLTFERAASETNETLVTKIKNATCAVAEEIQTVENDGGSDGIVSESIGSSSVTYGESSSRRQTAQRRYRNTAKIYLGSTGLLFQGFAANEYGA